VKTAACADGDAKDQVTVIRKLLKRVEQKLSGKDVKASLGDYIRLVQLEKELDEETPREIKVTWNQSQFAAQYGHAMEVITANDVALADYPDEVAYLPVVIGNFTDAIKSFVLSSYLNCRFEVLYPTDVNQTAFNGAINFPAGAWTPAALTVLKTEAFGFTLGRNLDKSEECIDFGDTLGFPAAQRSHLVGIGDVATAWPKEAAIAEGKRFESVVLFALDQFCLIGYHVPLLGGERRSVRQGG
jgi:hypothetical protein